MTLLRPILRSVGGFSPQQILRPSTLRHKKPTFFNGIRTRQTVSRGMGTQSTDDAKAPTASATLYLEDGTKLVGKSFGSHESVEGEVSLKKLGIVKHQYEFVKAEFIF